MQILGSMQNTAQVHPEKLTKAMMAAAESRGAQVQIGTVQNIVTDEGPAARVTGLQCTSKHDVLTLSSYARSLLTISYFLFHVHVC